MLLITISINGTLSRFLAIDFEQNVDRAKKTFNTAFFSLLLAVLFLLPLAVLFSFNIESFLNIPEESLTEAHYLFLLVFIAFLLNAFTSLYSSVAYVKNRIDLRNASIILTRVITILVLIGVFVYGFIEVQIYGFAVLVGTIVGLSYSFYVFKKLSPELKIKIEHFDKESLSRMATMGFWLIINQIGVLFFLQTDIIILNYFKGAELSGTYAVLLQWSFLIRALVAIIAGVIGPLVLNLYAIKDLVQLKQLTLFSTKVLGLFTVFISSILIYFSGDILYIWVGQDFVQYKWVFILLMVHLGFNLATSAIVNINVAYNKVKIPGIVTLVTGLLNVLLGIFLLLYTSFGLYGIAIAGLVSLTLKNFVFTPYYAARIMKMDYKSFYKPILPSILVTIGVLLLTVFLPSDFLSIGDSYLKLFFYMISFAIILSLFIYQALLKKGEKSQLVEVVKSKI